MSALAGAVEVLGHAVAQRDALERTGIVDASGLAQDRVALGVEENGVARGAVDLDGRRGRLEYHFCRGGGPNDAVGGGHEHGALRAGEAERALAGRDARHLEDVGRQGRHGHCAVARADQRRAAGCRYRAGGRHRGGHGGQTEARRRECECECLHDQLQRISRQTQGLRPRSRSMAGRSRPASPGTGRDRTPRRCARRA